MLNLELMTERDRKEAAAIERRRRMEDARKKRIFDPKTRLFGIDYEALDRQIAEKKKNDDERKRIEQIMDLQMVKNDEIALAYERKEKQERAKLLQEINSFRQVYQRFEDRREFDINDPNAIKKDIPARIHDDDPRLGPSSAQKFEGEDLVSGQRLRIQREQIKAWLDQQMQEKEAALKEQKVAEEAYKAAMVARDERALQLERMEMECRKRLYEANRRFNAALAAEKEFERKVQMKQTTEDNFAEIYNTMTSDMMAENPEIALSNLGPGRKISSQYKGMSREEQEQIRLDQLAQIEEKKKQKAAEKRAEREFDDYLNGTQKTIALMDLDLKRKEKERLKALAEENLKMAEEQKLKTKYMEQVVYSNRPTAAFFDQFNKSTR
ncbi:RIB43A-like with coiled-coils protein 2 [Coccinella septempunctata]|uniref:RIB43A-like with coiled-coils protein 2 n=1 Tax=Coccinella septempunctata TaxID=41139 RepID=UPI001D087159|nr:RIB43A-like with coiled-coils protein 2 [Coccinella septempunctata]